jgi:hypothetical protein
MGKQHKSPSKLILFDGFSGGGKSTQAQWLEVQLLHAGQPVRWYWEAEIGHPLNWFSDWWQPDFDMAVYFNDVRATMQHSLDIWEGFVQWASQSNTVTILDGWPFLMSICMFLQGDAPRDALLRYGRHVQKIIEPLSPTVVYFHQPDSRQALRWILDIRGDDVQNELFYNMERFPFCKTRRLTGFECVAQLWQNNQEIMGELLSGYATPPTVIDITAQTWDACRAHIVDRLGLEPRTERIDGLDVFVGAYRGEQSIDIRFENGALVAQEGKRSTRLLHIRDQHFYLEGLPVTLAFHDEALLTVDAVRMAGSIYTLSLQ